MPGSRMKEEANPPVYWKTKRVDDRPPHLPRTNRVHCQEVPYPPGTGHIRQPWQRVPDNANSRERNVNGRMATRHRRKDSPTAPTAPEILPPPLPNPAYYILLEQGLCHQTPWADPFPMDLPQHHHTKRTIKLNAKNDIIKDTKWQLNVGIALIPLDSKCLLGINILVLFY